MSGFLSALLGGSNQVGPGQSAAIANVLQQVLSQNGGGIATLISRFTDAGLGDHVQSWVSGDAATHYGRSRGSSVHARRDRELGIPGGY